jgi:hypothetical protein
MSLSEQYGRTPTNTAPIQLALTVRVSSLTKHGASRKMPGFDTRSTWPCTPIT